MAENLEFIKQLNMRGEFEQAQELARAGMIEDPKNIDYSFEYALALARQLSFDKVVDASLAVINSSHASGNQAVFSTRLLCVAFASLGVPEDAFPFIERFDYLSKSPHCSDRCWKGKLLLEVGAVDDALDSFQLVLDAFPGHTYARYCLGTARLSRGDGAGFMDNLQFAAKDFWRVFHPQFNQTERMWEGEPLEGKSITIVPQGGFGDYFQYSRFVSALRSGGATEIIAVSASMSCAKLLLSAGFDRVVGLAAGEVAKRDTDYWTSTFGLEHARLWGAPQGSSLPYLTAPTSVTADQILTQIRQNAVGKPCIGIYWHSDADGGENKSVPFHEILRLLNTKDVHWVILQRGSALRRLQLSGVTGGFTVLDEEFSFDETGALLTGLDGVVSICAWALHLAAALGVRTWFLAGRVMNSRHENKESDSVLYPGIVTLARQPVVGDWRGAIRILIDDVSRWISDRDSEARGRH